MEQSDGQLDNVSNNTDLLGFEHVDNPASISNSNTSTPQDMKEFDDMMRLNTETTEPEEHAEKAAIDPEVKTASPAEIDLLGALGDVSVPNVATVIPTEPSQAPPVVTDLENELTPAPKAANPCCALIGSLHPCVLDVLYWRDAKQSGIAFVSVMSLLYCIANYSIISVIAHLLLALLAITMSYRLYKNLIQAIKKEPTANPFNEYLEMEMGVSEERAQDVVAPVLQHLNCTVQRLRAVLLVQDIVESIKYGVFFWMLSCVGSCFNMMTLLNLAAIALFSLPKVYEMYQEPIDNYYSMIVDTVGSTLSSVTSKIPFLKAKAKEE